MSDSHDKAMTVVERPGERSMSPVVAAIMERNLAPETVREMLAVQREYEANEARKAYAMALVGLKRDLPTVIERDATVDFTSKTSGQRTFYHYASLAGVMDAITEPLTQHGFSVAWKPSTGKDGVTVVCRLAHAAGHYEEASVSAPPDTSGSKSPAQAVASTITLLSRYTALSLLGIATRDMEEPTGEEAKPDPGRVDSQRNLSAVGKLKKLGKTREEAEKFLGDKKVSNWTDADLKRLEAWARPAVKHATDCGVNAPGGGAKCDCGAK